MQRADAHVDCFELTGNKEGGPRDKGASHCAAKKPALRRLAERSCWNDVKDAITGAGGAMKAAVRQQSWLVGVPKSERERPSAGAVVRPWDEHTSKAATLTVAR